MMSRSFRCGSALALALVLSGGAAHAQGENKAAAPAPGEDKTALAKAEYQKAVEQFGAGNFVEAVKSFKKAHGYKNAPALLFNIAVCYRKLDEKDLAAVYFERFLKEADAKAPNRAEAEKQLAELKAAGATIATVEAPPAPLPPGLPPQMKPVDKFEHTPPDESPPGKPLDIRAAVPEKGGPYKLTLYWRAAGQADYTIAEMQRRYFEYVGRVPPTATTGKSIQYYLIVKDPAGKTYAKSGSPTQPNLVLIVEGAKPVFYADLAEGMGATGEAPKPTADAPPPAPAPKPKTGADDESPLAPKNAPAPAPEAAATDTASGGPTWMTYGKYGAVGLSALTLILAITSNGTASESAEKLQKDANRIPGDTPNAIFTGERAKLEADGRDAESTATLMASFSIGLAAAAGALFYLDWRAGRAAPTERKAGDVVPRTARVKAAPAIGPGFYGFAGEVRF